MQQSKQSFVKAAVLTAVLGAGALVANYKIQTSSPPVNIVAVTPNDDSAMVSFAAVKSAADYRAYKVDSTGAMTHPSRVKYSGGSLSIEVNGLTHGVDNLIIVEAVDALGPFQDMMPSMMPSMDMIINGQGPTTNIPNVIARSSIIHITPVVRTLSGQQAFFDNFENESPITQTPAGKVSAECSEMNVISSQALYEEYENNLWSFRVFDDEPTQTQLFNMSNHFMDILYDYHGILRAKMAMIPKSFPTLSAGQYLHITFEVDSHLDLNRTVGVAVIPKSALLNYDLVTDLPTTHGPSVDWQITGAAHIINLGDGVKQTPVGGSGPNVARWVQQWASGPMGGGFNGDQGDLDKRHRFDLYMTEQGLRLTEQGQIVRQAAFPVKQSWLLNQPLQIVFYHYLYHDRADNIYLQGTNFMYPMQTYWLGPRSWSDERHWDNIGIEVPTIPTNYTVSRANLFSFIGKK